MAKDNFFFKGTFWTQFGYTFDAFFFINWPFFTDFWDLRGAKKDSKQGPNRLVSFSCSCQMLQDHLWRNMFVTNFDRFLLPKRPIFKALWHFPWSKTCSNKLQTG